jgi:hypothetical protein
MGRKAHKPDPFERRRVEAMAGYGVSEADIARVVGIDAKTLRRHYRNELSTGHIKAAAKVAESLFRKATTDGPQSVTAAIFWLKTRVGWKETTAHEIAGRDGRPIETTDVGQRELAKSILAVLGTAELGLGERPFSTVPLAGDT